MANLTLKKDPYLLGFAGVLIIVVGALVYHGDVSWKAAAAFLAAALALPGLFGAKDQEQQDPPADPPPSVTP